MAWEVSQGQVSVQCGLSRVLSADEAPRRGGVALLGHDRVQNDCVFEFDGGLSSCGENSTLIDHVLLLNDVQVLGDPWDQWS